MARVSLVFLTNTMWKERPNLITQDIVDTVPYDGYKLTYQDMVKILAGAINRRVDNQNKYTPR